MTEARTLDVSRLRVAVVSEQSPLYLGQVIFALIEASLFLILFAVYLYLRTSVEVWPAPGAKLPNLTLGTIALVPLLISCFGSYWASEAARRDDRQGMLRGLGFNLALGVLFMVFRFREFQSLNFNWASDAHGSIVWSILFLHTYDVVADLIMTTVLMIIVLRGRYGPRQLIGVDVDSVLWYFLVGIWIPMYGLIYWAPRVLGGGK